MVKACLIWNPFAGNPQNNKRDINLIVNYLKERAYEVAKKETEGPLTAIEIAKEAVKSNYSIIYAFGGDGTINEIINGICGSNVVLGIIPKGTANLLAREINMPLNIKKALLALDKAKPVSVNLGRANNRYFILMLGIGYDAYVISKIKLEHKLKWGKLAFAYQAMKQSFIYDYPYFTIKFNQKEVKSTFAVVSLSKEYGSIFSLTPQAKLTQDYFQICLFRGAGSISYWKYFFYAVANAHFKLKDVQLDFSEEIEIYSDKEMWTQLDGELYCKLPVKISLVRNAVKILVPPYSKYF